MYPRLFELGPVTVYTYGVLLAAAYLLGLKLAMVRAKARGLDANRVLDLGIYIIISASSGRSAAVVTDAEMLCRIRASCNDAGALRVFYGGLILAVVVALISHQAHRACAVDHHDVFAPGHRARPRRRTVRLPVRCCFGKPTTLPWASRSTTRLPRPTSARRSACRCIPRSSEAGAELIILGILLVTERKAEYPGRTFWLYMLLYSVSRFIIEFYRGDDRGNPIGTLSPAR
jgi:phosphatidylglycerol:prolipoprotein diacylglycerol transferase